MKDNLGDRMKYYENISATKLIHQMPIILRIDGKAFHTFTKHFCKPFDSVFIDAMKLTTKDICEEVQNCRFGYVESDEISLLVYPKDVWNSEAYFDAKVQKLCSIIASFATIRFYRNFSTLVNAFVSGTKEDNEMSKVYLKAVETNACFDCRCFNLPKEEVCNYFIWRQQDATKNSIQMVARTHFSHKELQGKKFSDMNEMLFNKGVNFDKLPTVWKRGTAVYKVPTSIPKTGQQPIIRDKWFIDEEMPIITENRNYIENHII